ncbi:MAG: hypothetical protein MJZ23_10005 [Paludibacteraceae bacterium]|nr:hypothetical protein [Paludibacteraceae bacterium]
MKTFFRFTSVIALVSMLGMCFTATSCSNDEDPTETVGEVDYSNFDWSETQESIEATPATKIYAMNTIKSYTIDVQSARNGRVEMLVNGNKVILSEADNMVYLSTSLQVCSGSRANNLPSGVLLALKKGSTTLISGKLSDSKTIANKANETYFVYAK